MFLQLNLFPVFFQVEFIPPRGRGAFGQNIYPWVAVKMSHAVPSEQTHRNAYESTQDPFSKRHEVSGEM